MKTAKPKLIMTDRDYQRLTELLEWMKADGLDLLWDELARAQIIPQNEVPQDVVTMNSVVAIRDEETGEENELRLVYPNQSDIEQGHISVLAPVGMALLGLRVGQAITWPVPSGKIRKLKVTSIQFQPEAKGQYAL